MFPYVQLHGTCQRRMFLSREIYHLFDIAALTCKLNRVQYNPHLGKWVISFKLLIFSVLNSPAHVSIKYPIFCLQLHPLQIATHSRTASSWFLFLPVASLPFFLELSQPELCRGLFRFHLLKSCEIHWGPLEGKSTRAQFYRTILNLLLILHLL